jgi:hypothetical protein
MCLVVRGRSGKNGDHVNSKRRQLKDFSDYTLRRNLLSSLLFTWSPKKEKKKTFIASCRVALKRAIFPSPPFLLHSPVKGGFYHLAYALIGK